MDIELLNKIPENWYWLFLFFSVFVENIFPPYPGDTIVVFTGYLTGTKHIGLVATSIAIFTGNLLSASLMYFFGHELLEYVLKRVKNKNIREVFSKKHLERTHIWFEKHGIWAVIFSRFSAGIRFFIAIAAGIAEMPFIVFLVAFSIATIVWNSLLVYGGYTLGKNWDSVLTYVKLYSSIIALVLIIGLMIWLYRITRDEKKKKN